MPSGMTIPSLRLKEPNGIRCLNGFPKRVRHSIRQDNPFIKFRICYNATQFKDNKKSALRNQYLL